MSTYALRSSRDASRRIAGRQSGEKESFAVSLKQEQDLHTGEVVDSMRLSAMNASVSTASAGALRGRSAIQASA